MNNDELFKLAVSTRQFEIQMLWQRSNYFMVLNTAFAIGFFALKDDRYAALVALLGLLACVVWCNVNIGAKYWQSRWEEAAARFERLCAPEAKLFAASESEIRMEVAQSLANNRHGALQRWLDVQILKKPSVSFWMTVLSFSFVVIWLLLLIRAL